MNIVPALWPLDRGNCTEKVLDYNTGLFWVSSPRGCLKCVSRTGCLFHTINSVYIHAYKRTPPSAQAYTYRYIRVPVCARTHKSIHPPSILFPPQSTRPVPFFILHSSSQAHIDSSIFIIFLLAEFWNSEEHTVRDPLKELP